MCVCRREFSPTRKLFVMPDLECVSLWDRVLGLFTPYSTERVKLWWETLERHEARQPLVSKPMWDNLVGEAGRDVHGPDVSHHQGRVDWDAVRATGASFAFAKASEGEGWEDPRFDENWAEMGRVGLVRGAYHFARVSIKDKSASKADRLAQVAHDALQEATWFCWVVYNGSTPQPGDLPLVLDIEWDKRAKGVKSKEIVHFCKAFSAEVVRVTGMRPVIYTGPSFWKYKLGKTASLADHSLWLVEGYKSPAGQPEGIIPGWDWTFHQYTNKRLSPGSGRGHVDWNVFRGRKADLAEMSGVSPYAQYA